MYYKDIIKLIFEDSKDVQTISGDSGEINLHETILDHGISTKRFLCLDYKCEYEFLPEKIREVNKIISEMGYGLYSYPTFSDFYALFINKLEKQTKLLQVEFNIIEGIPLKENLYSIIFKTKKSARDTQRQMIHIKIEKVERRKLWIL